VGVRPPERRHGGSGQAKRDCHGEISWYKSGTAKRDKEGVKKYLDVGKNMREVN